MTDPVALLRCADAADRRGDALPGTAPPVAEWLLVEQPGPWGSDALTQSRLDPEVGTRLVEAARAAGVRVLLVRRPGRSPLDRLRRWARVVSRPGEESVRWGHFTDDQELVSLLAAPAAAGEADDGPVLLVCAHARHDPCCALRGRAVAAALAAAYPRRTWECSHVGGCRFAANMLVLPHGLYYGHTDGAAAVAAVEAYTRGELHPTGLRGRSALPQPVQAAQHEARLLLRAAGAAADGLDDLVPVDAQALPGREWAVVLDAPFGRLRLTLREEPTGPASHLTCAARALSPPRRYVLVSVE